MSEPAKPTPSPAPAPDKSLLGGWLKRARTIRDAPSYMEGMWFGTACVGVVLFIWWILTRGEVEDRIVGPLTLPSPGETIASFKSLWFDRELSRATAVSLGRVLGGFLLTVAIGVPLGIICGSYFRVAAFFRPLTVFGRSIPVAALVPLTMMWFGLGEFNKVMFIFIASIAFVLFDSSLAAQTVHDRFIDTAYTLGAKGSRKKGVRFAALAGAIYALLINFGWIWLREEDRIVSLSADVSSVAFWMRMAAGFVLGFLLWYPIAGHQVMRKVIFPMALPDIVNSLRLSFGLCFGYIMLAEMVNAKTGLGAILIMSERRGPKEHIYLCLIIISLLAWAIDRTILAVQRYLFPHLKNGQA